MNKENDLSDLAEMVHLWLETHNKTPADLLMFFSTGLVSGLMALNVPKSQADLFFEKMKLMYSEELKSMRDKDDT